MRLRSFNFPNRYVRHRLFEGFLEDPSTGPARDFDFLVEQTTSGVRLRSVNFPHHYLRHRNFRLILDTPVGPQDDQFRLDSTFVRVPGLAHGRGLSLRSVNFRDRYVRHRDFKLFLDPRTSPNLAADATFFASQRLAEPEGKPAED